jgi:hypothetical protein
MTPVRDGFCQAGLPAHRRDVVFRLPPETAPLVIAGDKEMEELYAGFFGIRRSGIFSGIA